MCHTLIAYGTRPPNESTLAHLTTALGFAVSVFHGWGDFEGLKPKPVPDLFVG